MSRLTESTYNKSSYDYYLFIKSFLVNLCYTEYSKVVYEENPNDRGPYFRGGLLEHVMDVGVWDTVFSKPDIHDVFRYYVELYRVYQEKESPLTSRVAMVYLPQTFQDYIDTLVTLDKVGAYDYQRFMQSMTEPGFYQNMVAKFEHAELERTLKNHVVYVAKLTILNQVLDSSQSYFTETEANDVVQFINIVPYFEFVAEASSSVASIVATSVATIENINFQTLESKVMDCIQRRLLQV